MVGLPRPRQDADLDPHARAAARPARSRDQPRSRRSRGDAAATCRPRHPALQLVRVQAGRAQHGTRGARRVALGERNSRGGSRGGSAGRENPIVSSASTTHGQQDEHEQHGLRGAARSRRRRSPGRGRRSREGDRPGGGQAERSRRWAGAPGRAEDPPAATQPAQERHHESSSGTPLQRGQEQRDRGRTLVVLEQGEAGHRHAQELAARVAQEHRAGGKLKCRSRAARRPGWPPPTTPTSRRGPWPPRRAVAVEIATTPVASPSSPSIRLIALAIATVHTMSSRPPSPGDRASRR